MISNWFPDQVKWLATDLPTKIMTESFIQGFAKLEKKNQII